MAMSDGIARAGFDIDLRHGEAREDALVHALLGTRVEVKSDGKARMTGNVAVEYQTSSLPDGQGEKRPSGVTVTTAHRWALEFDDDCWLVVPTEVVKGLARRAIREGKHRWVGDSNRFHCALVPLTWFMTQDADLTRDLPTLDEAREQRRGEEAA